MNLSVFCLTRILYNIYKINSNINQTSLMLYVLIEHYVWLTNK